MSVFIDWFLLKVADCALCPAFLIGFTGMIFLKLLNLSLVERYAVVVLAKWAVAIEPERTV